MDFCSGVGQHDGVGNHSRDSGGAMSAPNNGQSNIARYLLHSAATDVGHTDFSRIFVCILIFMYSPYHLYKSGDREMMR